MKIIRLLLATILVWFVAASYFSLLAGGPLGANGTTPKRYPAAAFPLTYKTDLGSLGAFSNTTAVSIAVYAFTQWDNVLSAALSFTNGGSLARDVTSATDTYISGAGQYSDGVNPIVFDTDGSITDAKLGVGAKNSVLGFAGSAWSGNSYVEGYAIINGYLSGSGTTSDQDKYKATITHEIGHFLGLAHPQDAMHGAFATMYPIIESTSQKTLSPDDTAAIAALYPTTAFTNSVGAISGTVKKPDGTNLSGVDVIAEDSVSGASYSTIVDYFSGDNSSSFTNKPTASGSYTISGLPPGKYFIRIEPVKSEFTSGSSVASYDTPINGSVAREWYNGAGETGDMLTDNTNQKTGVTVTAGSTTSGINITSNESNTTSSIVYHNGTPSTLFALPSGSITAYSTKFTAPSNGSLVGVKFRVDASSSLPLNGTLTVTVYSNTSGSLAGIPGAVLGSVTIPYSDIAPDQDNEVWLRGLGTAVNFNSGDNFHVGFSTNGAGSFNLLSDNGSTVTNRSSYFTSASGWRNFPQGYPNGTPAFNLIVSALYSTTVAGNPVPAISISPTALDFGRVRPINTADRQITVTNTGTATLNVTGTAILGHDSTAFSVIANGGSFSLAANASRIITVRFSSVRGGAAEGPSRSATLSIVSNAATSPTNVPLTGLVVEPTAGKMLTTIAFGSLRTGSTATNTYAIIHNVGNDTLHISGVALTGPDAGTGLRLLSSTGAAIVPPDSIFTVRLQFSPTQMRAYLATLTVTHDDSSGSSVFAVTGSGTSPVVSVVRDTMSFGNVRVSTSGTQQISIVNSGNAPLNISSIRFSGGDSTAFRILAPTSFPIAVAAGDSVVLRVQFSPNEKRLYAATIRVSSDASPATHDIVVMGTGTAPVVSVFPSFDAGSSRVGVAKNVSVAVRNIGTAPLSVTAIQLSGTNAGDFAVVGPALPATIAVGDSLLVQLRFTPSAFGGRSADLKITTDDPSQPVADILLTGMGLQGRIAISPQPRLDFGDVALGASSTQYAHLLNTGTDVLTVSSVALTGGGFTLAPAPAPPLTIAPGDSALVPIRFQPGSAGNATGTLTVVSDVGGSMTYDLVGRGVAPGLAVSKSSLAFGNIPVNQERLDSFAIRNTGIVPLTNVQVQLSSNPSSAYELLSPASYVTVLPGEQVMVVVRFKAQSNTGIFPANVRVTAAGGAQSDVTVSATVAKSMLATVSQVDFGTRLGAGIFDTLITVQNNGTAPLVIDSIHVTGAKDGVGGNYFTVIASTPFTVDPGGATQVRVRLDASSGPGTYSGSMSFGSDSPLDPAVTVALHGVVTSTTGIADPFTASFSGMLSAPRIVPNPARDFADLHVVLGSGALTPLELSVVDSRGALVWHTSVSEYGGAHEELLRLNTAVLPSGSYHVIARFNGRTTTGEMIVVK